MSLQTTGETKEKRTRVFGSVDTLQLLTVKSTVDEKSSSFFSEDHSKSDHKSSNDSFESFSSENSIRLRKSSRKRQRFEASDEDASASHSDFHFSSSSENDEHDIDEDLAVINTIIAKKKDTLHNWNELCKKMNTCEIERGSLWSDAKRKMTESEFHREEIRYLIRWEDCSYIHCSWETERDLLEYTSNGEYQLRSFNAKFNESGCRHDAIQRNNGEFFDPEYIKIDRILDIQEVSNSGKVILDPTDSYYDHSTGRQFLIKWKSRSYGESSYEHERDLINMGIEYESHVDLYLKRIQKPSTQKLKDSMMHQERYIRSLYKVLGDTVSEKSEKVNEYVQELQSFSYPDGRQLRGYQAEGLAWLIRNYINRRSSILADEMGLGKTISTAAFLQTLFTSFHNRGPFLIIAPLSTLPQWHRELQRWTNLNVIMYTGNSMDKAIIHEFEFPFHSDRPAGLRSNQKYLKNCHRSGPRVTKRSWMPNIVITSPESFVKKDTCELIDVEWEVLVFDEAHARLKNDKSRLSLALRDEKFVFKHLLLLTGTPIQNNTTELWNMLHVIDGTKFGDREYFLERYGNMRNKNQVEELHTLLRPYILRRLKEDVEKNLPPKEETIIEVELTVLQKQYYRALFEKNLAFLNRGDKGFGQINNVCMQLRKCCNHPYLLDGVEYLINNKQVQTSENQDVESLIKASGKLVLLDKLLPKLKDGGHRVLLFSQFKIMLDIIEDYLVSRKFGYERIDGNVIGSRRQQAIDRFQAPDSSSFIMMLSTKAGGVGINLTGADTCILFDSDWNPQNDLQAQARCHRIGQTKPVKVYRLLCRKSYEMRLFQLASMKMGLDKVVMNGVENGDTKSIISDHDAERLLRYGAYDVFSEDPNSEKETQKFLDEDIETILLRRTTANVGLSEGPKLNFSKAWFRGGDESTSEDGNESNDVDVDDPDFWLKIMNKHSSSDIQASHNSYCMSPYYLDTTKQQSDIHDTSCMSDSDFSITSADTWESQSKMELSTSKDLSTSTNSHIESKRRNSDSQITPLKSNIKVPKNPQDGNIRSSNKNESGDLGDHPTMTSPIGSITQRRKSRPPSKSDSLGKVRKRPEAHNPDLIENVSSNKAKNIFESVSPRKSPRKHVMNGSYKERWLCSRCGVEFSSEVGLEYHMDNMVCLKDMDQVNPKQVEIATIKSCTVCEYCSRQFSVPAGLQYHLSKKVCIAANLKAEENISTLAKAVKKNGVNNDDTHSIVDKKPIFKCHNCSKTYRVKGRLENHIAKNICTKSIILRKRAKTCSRKSKKSLVIKSLTSSEESQPVSSSKLSGVHQGLISTAQNLQATMKNDNSNPNVTSSMQKKVRTKRKSRVSIGGSDILQRLAI